MKLNTAQQILKFLGVPHGDAKSDQSPQHRKAGPGRKHAYGNGSRTVEQKRAGSFGRGLRNWIANKQRAAIAR